MIKIEDIDVDGWRPAIRGMRNPMNSWKKSDTIFDGDKWCLGNNDLKLMQQLSAAGNDHAKFLRMLVVTMDITAPLYWWKEFDTYKVGTVANSCSTMHRIHAKEFTLDDFSSEHLIDTSLLESVINELNIYRSIYINYDKQTDKYMAEFPKKDIWWQMIQLLPSSYNQKRTVQLNYQVLKNMYFARKSHKLDEWHTFCEEVKKLPYFKEICIEPVSYKHS